MALARGGPTRSRSESVALVKEYSTAYGGTNYPAWARSDHSTYYSGIPVHAHARSHGGVVSIVPGVRGVVANTNGVVANTNGQGHRYVSDGRCQCPYIDGSDGGEFCGVDASGLYQGRTASVAEVISDPSVGCGSCFQRCYELNPGAFCPMLTGPSPCGR